MSRIIAACNQKGGVGKTTTCVNVSAALAAMEKRTLLVDMDPQANATQGLGFDVPFEEDVYDAMLLDDSEVKKERIQKFIQKNKHGVFGSFSMLQISGRFGSSIAFGRKERSPSRQDIGNRKGRLRFHFNRLPSQSEYSDLECADRLGLCFDSH